MAVTHIIGTTYRSNNGTVSVPSVSVTGDSELVFDGTIPASTTNFEIDIAIDVSAMKAYAFSAGGACTVKTNSSSSPVDTITFTSTVKGAVWYDGSTSDALLTADVTKLFVTNPGSSSITFKLVALLDVTPA